LLVFTPPAKLNAGLLYDCFRLIIENLAKQAAKLREEKLPESTLEAKINIDDKILSIRQMLLDKMKVNFSRLLAAAATRTEVIVSFLAILELAKQKELFFEQDELFSDIHISKI